MKIIALNKPLNVLSQFRQDGEHQTLADFITDPTLRVSGRLDRDSEGLLLLTDHGGINNTITSPKKKQYKVYLAQVEGDVTQSAIDALEKGVELNDGLTLPAKVKKVEQPEWLWERNPPIRYRANIPTTWLEIQIMEGRNRQVRRMTAKVGFPTLRLVRIQIGSIKLENLGLEVGDQREIEPLLHDEFRAVLNEPEKPTRERFNKKPVSTSSRDTKKTNKNKKRDKVRAEIFKSDVKSPRRITNGTTRPNTKSRGRRPR
ncbi:pseudouridine synthase [Acinetobacter sp. HY1485]|uniref:pseudouridine synthase n=1 Tax=Acinetobacter sp. HY1485 TaxID=2970918 RepID=UPI0022B9685B|nr:pseudouridine synthase [Acinetobacter sp. HY1485]